MAWHYAIPGKITNFDRTSSFTWPNIQDPGGNVKFINKRPHWQWIQCVLHPGQLPIKTKTIFEKGGIQKLEPRYEPNQYVSAMLLHSTQRNHIMCAYRNEMDISPPELKHFTVIDDIYPNKRETTLDKLVETDDTLTTCFVLMTRGHHLGEAIFTGIPTVPKNDNWRCLSASCLVILMRMPLIIWDILSRINNNTQFSIAGWLQKTIFLKQCLDIYERAKSEGRFPLSFKITYDNVEQANKSLCGVYPDNKDGIAIDFDACITSISTELQSLSELASILKFEIPLTDSDIEFLCEKKTLYDNTYHYPIDEKINCSQPLGLIYTDSPPPQPIDQIDALTMGFSTLSLDDKVGFHMF